MIPDPLHPAIVHFPIVFAVLAPLLAATVYWAIHSGRTGRRSWIGVVLFQLILVTTAWVTTETGEREEDRVEHVVAERHIESHEADAESFLVLTAVMLPFAAVGLLAGPIGAVGRAMTIALSLATMTTAGLAGHSGGELVYRHGAAAAYLPALPGEIASRVIDAENTADRDDDEG